jgi:hypothetical protein
MSEVKKVVFFDMGTNTCRQLYRTINDAKQWQAALLTMDIKDFAGIHIRREGDSVA